MTFISLLLRNTNSPLIESEFKLISLVVKVQHDLPTYCPNHKLEQGLTMEPNRPRTPHINHAGLELRDLLPSAGIKGTHHT